MMCERLHTLRMLARRLRPYGLSMAWLRAEAEAGRIPSLRAGRRLMFNVAAVEQALLERAGTIHKKDPAGYAGSEKRDIAP